MGATSTASGSLEMNPCLSKKRVGKSHFGMFLVSAVSGIRRFCIASHSLLPMSMQTRCVSSVASFVAKCVPSLFQIKGVF